MNQCKPTLYLVRGLPGAGKSTLAMSLFNSGLVQNIFEADQWFVENCTEFRSEFLRQAHLLCQHRTSLSLNQGFSCCVSNTSTTEKEVQVYQDIATSSGAKFVSLVVENRNNTKSIHCVPDETLEKMRNRFTFKL
jgi:predicted kinase